MLEKNRTIHEHAGAAKFRRLHAERQNAKRASERAIAGAQVLPPGPKVTSSVERQPAHRRPRMVVR